MELARNPENTGTDPPLETLGIVCEFSQCEFGGGAMWKSGERAGGSRSSPEGGRRTGELGQNTGGMVRSHRGGCPEVCVLGEGGQVIWDGARTLLVYISSYG